MPDAHALQAFATVAQTLCRRGLALEYYACNHALVDLIFQGPGGVQLVFRPGQGRLPSTDAPLRPNPQLDSLVALRFPDHASFFDLVASYMSRNVPGEVWMAAERGPIFDPQRDFAIHQALRAVREAMAAELHRRWTLLQLLLGQDGGPADDARVLASPDTTRCWHSWLWLVEEICQLNYLQVNETACQLSDLPEGLAWEMPTEPVWRRLQLLMDGEVVSPAGEADADIGAAESVTVVTRGAIGTSTVDQTPQLPRLHYRMYLTLGHLEAA